MTQNKDDIRFYEMYIGIKKGYFHMNDIKKLIKAQRREAIIEVLESVKSDIYCYEGMDTDGRREFDKKINELKNEE